MSNDPTTLNTSSPNTATRSVGSTENGNTLKSFLLYNNTNSPLQVSVIFKEKQGSDYELQYDVPNFLLPFQAIPIDKQYHKEQLMHIIWLQVYDINTNRRKEWIVDEHFLSWVTLNSSSLKLNSSSIIGKEYNAEEYDACLVLRESATSNDFVLSKCNSSSDSECAK
ncbi:hypothetical protein ABK040_012786 [Willaertia magna]